MHLHTGGDQHIVFHATIPFWSILFVHQIEGTGVQECGVDCRVHRTETQSKD